MNDPNALIQVIGMPILLIVLFYFLMIRPQQRRMKQHQAMLAALKRGDQVVLSSGMIGKVVKVGENYVHLEVAENTTILVQKAAIAALLPKGTIKEVS